MIGVLHFWGGQKPSDYGFCDPEDDLAVMAEYSATVNQMRAIESWETDKNNPKNKNKKK